MRIQGVFTAAKLLALVAVVIAGVVHIAGGQNILPYNEHGDDKCLQKLGFASPYIVILSTESANQMQQLLKFITDNRPYHPQIVK